MSLVYVTGLSGSGKSAVLRELGKQGYEAHGVDEGGYADWIDQETGAVVPFPHNDPSLDAHGWYKKHRWVLSQERIGNLKKRADDESKTIFLLGTAEGEDKVWHFFDKVMTLLVDAATLRSRIESRQDNHFGKDPEEMAAILGWLESHERIYRGFGATIIDATKPLEQVVNEVVNAAS